jgi:hypothetical protein
MGHYANLDIDGKNSIRIDFGEIGWKCVNWIHLAQDRV